MIRSYVEYMKKAFQNNVVYRMDCFAGIINTIVVIFVNIALWKAIFEEEGTANGLEFRMTATYIVLAFLMQCIFSMDEYFIEQKVQTGLITTDFIKPINFRATVLFYNLGTLCFRILMQLIPATVVSIILFRPLGPFSPQMIVCFLLSMVLGYLVLYNLNFIVWVTSFWFFRTFSLVTIKDALIMVLSGAVIPIWYMPQWLIDFIHMTPFEYIYYIPISLYLGQIPVNEIVTSIVEQLVWIVILYGVGQFLWRAATKKLVVQGG